LRRLSSAARNIAETLRGSTGILIKLPTQGFQTFQKGVKILQLLVGGGVKAGQALSDRASGLEASEARLADPAIGNRRRIKWDNLFSFVLVHAGAASPFSRGSSAGRAWSWRYLVSSLLGSSASISDTIGF
jgi:hypothetical protein